MAKLPACATGGVLSSRLRAFAMAAVSGIALLLASCDNYHHDQWVIRQPSPANVRKVKSVVDVTARESGLRPITSPSKVPDTITCHESEPPFQITLGARKSDGLLIVDLTCFHPGVKPPARYATARSAIAARLHASFGERLETRAREEVIPIRHASDTAFAAPVPRGD